MYYVYLLRCRDGSLYTGITTDPARRFAQHEGRLPGGAKYTAAHPPARLEAVWSASGRAAASRLERRIKALSHGEKERLAAGIVPDALELSDYSRVQDGAFFSEAAPAED